MQKIFVKGLGMGNIDLSIRLLRILTTHNFDGEYQINCFEFVPILMIMQPCSPPYLLYII